MTSYTTECGSNEKPRYIIPYQCPKIKSGVYGLLFILTFYIFRERPVIRMGVYTVIALLYSKLIPSLLIPMLLSVILITFFYNGEKGKYPNFSKYFMYIIYPIHYWIIYIVKYIA